MRAWNAVGLVALVGLMACESNGGSPDAGIDAPADAAKVLPDALTFSWSEWGNDCTASVYGVSTCASTGGEPGYCILNKPLVADVESGLYAGRCFMACETNAPFCPDGVRCRNEILGGDERYCWPF